MTPPLSSPGVSDDLDAAITAWSKLDGAVAEARLFPLAQFMGDVYAGALLTEQAAWERAEAAGPKGPRCAALCAAVPRRPWPAAWARRRRRRGHRTVR